MTAATPNPPPHLWLDLPDAHGVIDRSIASGHISTDEALALRQFREKGFLILPNAIAKAQTAAIRDELQQIHQEGEKHLVRRTSWKNGSKKVTAVTEKVLPRRSRLLDFHVNSERARNMVFEAKISRFLHLLYSEPALAFQSLVFTWGTEHEIHTDNAFIVADPPCSIVASWAALEDVDEGCGAVAYYPGSHQFPLFLFADNEIAWQDARDGKASKQAYVEYLNTMMAKHYGKPELFLAREGDVILWHANLVHYGTPVTDRERTRYSMLTHYCPASATPNYFRFFPEASKRGWRDDFYSSRRYDLRPGFDNPYPVYIG